MIYKAIAYLLTNYEPLTDLVGTNSYYMNVPQDSEIELPWVIFGQIDGERLEHLSGVNEFASGRFDVYSWAKDIQTANDVATEVRNALHHQTGIIADVSVRIIQAATGKEYTVDEEVAGDLTIVYHGYKQTFQVAYLEPDS